MKTLVCCIILLANVAYCLASPNTPYLLPGGKVVMFVNAPEAKQKILEDAFSAYFQTLTSLDMTIRMKKKAFADRASTMQAYQQFIQNSVMDWQPDEVGLMKKVLKDCQSLMGKVNADLVPDTLYVIKTSGQEEAESDYTRDKTVYLPQSRFADLHSPRTHEKLGKIMIHELFHIYSRYHPQEREQLYKAIGFTKIAPVDIGMFLSERKLTNPDACDYNYKITVKDKNNRDMEVMMMVYSKYPFFEEGKDLKSHLTFSLFEIESTNGKYAIRNGKQPKAINPAEVTGFFEQIGRNTNYIVHPDEILADNLRLLVLSKLDQKYIHNLDQEGVALLNKIEAIFKQ